MERRLLPALLLALAACGDGAPRYSLKQVMLEVDHYDKEAQRTLADPSAAAVPLREIQRWMADPAFEGYAESRWNAELVQGFAEKRALFRSLLDETLRAAEAGGDGTDFIRSYGRMRSACDICHATYRPELPGAK